MDCSICLTKLEDSVITNCGHSFHRNCLQQWMERNRTCPFCRNNDVKVYRSLSDLCKKFMELDKDSYRDLSFSLEISRLKEEIRALRIDRLRIMSRYMSYPEESNVPDELHVNRERCNAYYLNKNCERFRKQCKNKPTNGRFCGQHRNFCKPDEHISVVPGQIPGSYQVVAVKNNTNTITKSYIRVR